MKTIFKTVSIVLALGFFVASCSSPDENAAASASNEQGAPAAGQSAVKDDMSQPDVVKVAVGSPDHTTLVAAVQAAQLVDVLSNAGPFTVFAPVNKAFDALPAGTVEGLLKPEAKKDLTNILEYHVTTSALKEDYLKDGMKLGMVNGQSATITIVDGKKQINGANILAAVPASNGMVYVIDAVLLPPQK